MKIGYVYKITSPSGRIYVGSTISIKNRKYAYKNLKKSQSKLRNSLNKYGWENHKFEIVWEGDANLRLKFEREIGLSYNVLNKDVGLNLLLPKFEDLPTIYSQEMRDKCRTNRLGKKSKWNYKKVSIYNKDGHFIKTFESLKECSLYLNIQSSSISNALKSNYLLKKLYQVKKEEFLEGISPYKRKPIVFLETTLLNLKNRSLKNIYSKGRKMSKEDKERISNLISTPILKFDKQNNFIEEYKSITSAAKSNNISITAINNNLKNKSNSSGGFIWKYKTK